jgi:hypothetical protein
MVSLSWAVAERGRPAPFAEAIEERARQVAASAASSSDTFSVSSLIGEEVALRLDQIDRLRVRQEQVMQELRQAECEIETELMQMEQRTPRYSPYRFPEREKLQRRLARVGQERRKLTLTLAEKLDGLHDRLLSLLRKHTQVRVD